MYSYELIQIRDEQILKRSDGASIPFDERNRDYAEYLRYTEWVEAGNKPEDFWENPEYLALLEATESESINN
jgi:hypothetical protein